jgi:hypothetical protein
MKDNVRKELDTLEMMIKNWKRGYQSLVTSEENDESIIQDFMEDIDTLHVYPYITKLCEDEYITNTETREFLNKCYQHVADFAEEVRNNNDR